MFTMMNIMSMYDSLQVFAFFLKLPFQTLMHNNVMKNEIENSVRNYSNANSKEVWTIIHHGGIIEYYN